MEGQMRTLIIGLLLLCFTALFAAEAPIAIAMKLKGDVTVLRNKKELKVKAGDILYNKDEIKTGVESYAAIKYADDGALIKVFPNSIVSLKGEKKGKALEKSSYITKGNLYSKVQNKFGGTYKVESPTTVASVKGTEFFVMMNQDGSVSIAVIEGIVGVLDKQTGSSKDSPAGNSATVLMGGGVNVVSGISVPQEWLNEINELGIQSQEYKIQLMNKNGDIKVIHIDLE